MADAFFSEGRRTLLAQMLMNVCQYILIAAIATELLLKISAIQRVGIIAAAMIFGLSALLIWPKKTSKEEK